MAGKHGLYESFLTNHFFLLTSTKLGGVPRGQQLAWTRSSPWDSQKTRAAANGTHWCHIADVAIPSVLNTGQEHTSSREQCLSPAPVLVLPMGTGLAEPSKLHTPSTVRKLSALAIWSPALLRDRNLQSSGPASCYCSSDTAAVPRWGRGVLSTLLTSARGKLTRLSCSSSGVTRGISRGYL